MKKIFASLLTLLLFSSMLLAQQSDTITNKSVSRMALAGLDDELIIDAIRNSAVRFDLSSDEIAQLKSAGVSENVIKVMLEAWNASLPTAPEPKVTQPVPENPKPEPQPSIQAITPSKVYPVSPEIMRLLSPTEGQVAFTGYVNPLSKLFTLYEDHYRRYADQLSGWDSQTRILISKLNDTGRQIEMRDKDLREKKNLDAKAYTAEIKALRQQINELRNRYQNQKTELIAAGIQIIKNLTALQSEQLGSIKSTYSEVGQLVKDAVTSPASGLNIISVQLNNLPSVELGEPYLLPATETLWWYKNTIASLRDAVRPWNDKIVQLVKEDSRLAQELSPIYSQMEEYKVDSKRYKVEISALKKQISAKEKERKQLASQMEEDARSLSGYLKLMRSEIETNLDERFTDIVTNITYGYQQFLRL